MVKLAFVLLPLIILAIGCTRTKEVIVEQTVIVERTVIVVVTATPEPFLFTRLPPGRVATGAVRCGKSRN